MDSKQLLTLITGELAKTIDDTLIPQTTISSLGLKLATQLNWRIKSTMGATNNDLSPAAFINAVASILSSFDYVIVPIAIGKNQIRFKVKSCPFKQYQSDSLCSVMKGIIGGLGFLTFGYSKMVTIVGPDKTVRPCTVDLYLAPSDEADSKIGMEYSRSMISLLKGEDEKYISQQRQSRRKLILGLFSNLALSLRDNPSTKRLAQKFIESLSCIPEIRIAALYLREGDAFVLESDYGLPEESRYLIKNVVISDESITKADHNNHLLASVEEFNGERRDIANRTGVRSFASIKIASHDKIVGVLNIGWKSSVPISREISESLRAACSLLGLSIDNSRMYATLEQACFNSIAVLNELVNVVDHYSNNHSKRVAEISRRIAVEMDLAQDDIDLLFKAALIHDIGKVNVPPQILNKPEQLTDEEFNIIKEHPVTGAKLLMPIASLESIVPAVLYHHERLDGSGYPEGLTHDDIPLFARIIAVADAYDAMTATRAYRESISKDTAIAELVKGSDTKFDAVVIGALIAVLNGQQLDEDIFQFDHRLTGEDLAI
ncbi:MAG: HD domain-containing protein [Candidatus Aquicultor sp.]|nr:HD domain-containing protein [Candidatus Aquicultor sp.]